MNNLFSWCNAMTLPLKGTVSQNPEYLHWDITYERQNGF